MKSDAAMWDMNDVQEIEYTRDYIYRVKFDDGVSAEIDFSSYLNRGPVFEPLSDLDFFKRASIVGGVIAWPNGVDIAPETLYERASAAPENPRADSLDALRQDSPK